MSKTDFYMSNEPLITNLNNTGDSKIDVFGVPFDATSTYRTGSRFAPNAIREAFQNIEIYSKRLEKDLEEINIRDLGNLTSTYTGAISLSFPSPLSLNFGWNIKLKHLS